MTKALAMMNLMKNREQLYTLLSRLYILEVDEVLLKALKQLDYPSNNKESEMEDGFIMMNHFLALENEDVLDDLAVDYADIFLSAGVAQGKAAFPYESVYTSKKNLIMQASRNAVLKVYQEKGLLPSDGPYKTPEDHIGIELEFMAFLCNEAEKTIQDTSCDYGQIKTALKEQLEFLSQHLVNWAYDFCLDVNTYAKTDFYKGISKITSGFLKKDQEILESLVK